MAKECEVGDKVARDRLKGRKDDWLYLYVALGAFAVLLLVSLVW